MLNTPHTVSLMFHCTQRRNALDAFFVTGQHADGVRDNVIATTRDQRRAAAIAAEALAHGYTDVTVLTADDFYATC